MSVYKTNILAFINLLESKSNLFSRQDWVELHQIARHLPADEEEITERLENWLNRKSRMKLLQAYEDWLESLDSSSNIKLDQTLGFGNTQFPSPLNQHSSSAKELLENAIKKNSPLSDFSENH